MNPNLQPLRDLVDKWLHEDGDAGMQQAAEWCSLDLKATLEQLEASSCDCTSGRDHVHTGEQDD